MRHCRSWLRQPGLAAVALCCALAACAAGGTATTAAGLHHASASSGRAAGHGPIVAGDAGLLWDFLPLHDSEGGRGGRGGDHGWQATDAGDPSSVQAKQRSLLEDDSGQPLPSSTSGHQEGGHQEDTTNPVEEDPLSAAPYFDELDYYELLSSLDGPPLGGQPASDATGTGPSKVGIIEKAGSIESLLDQWIQELQATASDPLGSFDLLDGGLGERMAQDLLERISTNLEKQLAKLGTDPKGVLAGLSSYMEANRMGAAGGAGSASSGDAADETATAEGTESEGGSEAGRDVPLAQRPAYQVVSQLFLELVQLSASNSSSESGEPEGSPFWGEPARGGGSNPGGGQGPGDAMTGSGSGGNASAGASGSTEGSAQGSTKGSAEGGTQGSTKGRRLAQVPGTSGGRLAQAFRVVFGNFLDLLGGGGRWFATILANLSAFLLNANLIRESVILLQSPLENFINTNQVPIPNSNAAALALLLSVLDGYCSLQSVGSVSLVLGSFTAPSLSIELTPAECPIMENEDTGRRTVDWENCIPAQLVITTTPWEVQLPYVTGASFTAGFCRYQFFRGSDVSFSYGGGTASFTLRRTTRGIQIIPVVNQFSLLAQFAPYIFPERADYVSETGPSYVIGSSYSLSSVPLEGGATPATGSPTAGAGGGTAGGAAGAAGVTGTAGAGSGVTTGTGTARSSGRSSGSPVNSGSSRGSGADGSGGGGSGTGSNVSPGVIDEKPALFEILAWDPQALVDAVLQGPGPGGAVGVGGTDDGGGTGGGTGGGQAAQAQAPAGLALNSGGAGGDGGGIPLLRADHQGSSGSAGSVGGAVGGPASTEAGAEESPVRLQEGSSSSKGIT